MIPEEIERVALLGWAVFPSSQYSRKACFSGAHEAATSDLDIIEQWCRAYPGCNWRVAFSLSGLWGLDIDKANGAHKHDGIGNMRAFAERHGGLPVTPLTRSGGGGYAIFFRFNGEEIIGEGGHPVAGVDPRRGRQSVTIPPSIHPEWKRPYVWLRPPWEINPPIAPKWLADAVKPPPIPDYGKMPVLDDGDKARAYAVAALRHAIGRVATAPSGNANNTLNKEAFSMARFLRDGLISESEIRDCLIAASRARSIPLREAIATIESGLRSRLRG